MREGNMSEKLKLNNAPVEIDIKAPGNFGFISKERARNNRIEAEKWMLDKAVKKEDSMFHKGINERYNMLDAPEAEKLLPETAETDPVIGFEVSADLPIDVEGSEPGPAIINEVEDAPNGLESIGDLVDDKKSLEDLVKKAHHLAKLRSKIEHKKFNSSKSKKYDPSEAEKDKLILLNSSDEFNNLYYAYEGAHFMSAVDMEALESIQDIAYPLSSGESSYLNIDTSELNEEPSVESDDVIIEPEEIESNDFNIVEKGERIKAEIEGFSAYQELRDLAKKVNDLRYAGGEEYWQVFDKFNDLYDKFEETVDIAKGAIKDDEYRISKKALAQIKSQINAKNQNASNSAEPLSKVKSSEVSSHNSEIINEVESDADDERDLIEAKINEVAAFRELRKLAADVFESLIEVSGDLQSVLDAFNDKCIKLEGRINKYSENGMSTSETDIARKALRQIKLEAGVETMEASELAPDSVLLENPSSNPEKTDNNELNVDDEREEIEAKINKVAALKRLRGFASEVRESRNSIFVDHSKEDNFNSEFNKIDKLVDRAPEEKGMSDYDFEIMKKALAQIKSEAEAEAKSGELNPSEPDAVDFGVKIKTEIEELIKHINYKPEASETNAINDRSFGELSKEWDDDDNYDFPENLDHIKDTSYIEALKENAKERYNKAVSSINQKLNSGNFITPGRHIFGDGRKESYGEYYKRLRELGTSRLMSATAIAQSFNLKESKN